MQGYKNQQTLNHGNTCQQNLHRKSETQSAYNEQYRFGYVQVPVINIKCDISWMQQDFKCADPDKLKSGCLHVFNNLHKLNLSKTNTKIAL